MFDHAAWHGWQVKGNKLIDPNGYEFDAALLEHHQLLCQIAHANAPGAYNQLLDRWARKQGY